MKKIIMLFILWTLLISCWWAGKTQSDPNIDLNNITGKRTFLWFVATWCPHCQEEVPILDQFYRQYKGAINMQLYNQDRKKFNWDYLIPQDIAGITSYEKIAGETCEYVPSYVILDENGDILEKACWAKLTFEELQAKLLPDNFDLTMDLSYQTNGFQEWDLWVIMTTNKWKIEIRMFPSEAPLAVNNFLALSQNWYYNGITFHRVIKDFMIQWWDPDGTGMGWESIYGKEFEDEFSPKLHNIVWALSMANAGANTNGSQFFINQANNNFLDNKHTVFWQVVNGLDVVNTIAGSQTDNNDKPTSDVKIEKMEVVKYEKWKLSSYKFDFEATQKEQQAEKIAKQEADKNREVQNGDMIAVHYILTDKDGEELDNSYSRGAPLDLEVWAWWVIPGFDAGVVGMKIGETKTLQVPTEEAYGAWKESEVQEIDKSEVAHFEEQWVKIEKWGSIPTIYGAIPIIDVQGEKVKVDMNHPLAGKDLTFKVELVEFKN